MSSPTTATAECRRAPARPGDIDSDGPDVCLQRCSSSVAMALRVMQIARACHSRLDMFSRYCAGLTAREGGIVRIPDNNLCDLSMTPLLWADPVGGLHRGVADDDRSLATGVQARRSRHDARKALRDALDTSAG
jgi:hypothetical protein